MDNLLIALLALSPNTGKVAKRLVDAACYGIKRFLEPYFIAHEEKVKAQTELDIFRNNRLRQLEFAQEFLKNTNGRFPEEAVHDFSNIVKIIKIFVECAEGQQIEESTYTEEEDREWYARFFDEARYISDEQLQEVWGNLIAERIIHPGGVNNRVLYFIRCLDKREIECIRRSMRIFLNDDFTPDYVIGKFDGMSHDVSTLLSLRLIYNSSDIMHPLVSAFDLSKETIIKGKGYDFRMTALGNEQEVSVQCYALTPEGKVLSRLCKSQLSAKEAQMICDHLNACWKDKVRVEVVENHQ